MILPTLTVRVNSGILRSYMKTRDIVIGAIVLVILVTGVLLIRRARNNRLASLPTPTPSIQQRLQKTFNGLTIPTDRESADLTDVTGGQGIGVASRKFSEGTFSLTVMANLPSPKSGTFYQAFLFKDSSSISIGSLRLAKGGYIVDFTSLKDYSGYNRVVVDLEGKHVLEGSF